MAAFAGPLVGLAGGILNGILGNKAATELQAGSLNAANAANQTQWDQYMLNRSDLAPYTGAGQGAITTLANLLGISTPGGGTAGPSGDQSKKLNDLQTSLSWYQNVLAGKGAPGWNGGAPHNAATVAKMKGEMAQVQRQIDNLNAQVKTQTDQANLTASQDPSQRGSLMKDFTASDFNVNQDPGAQYRMQEAQKAIERSAAARGGVQSGGTLKALQQNSQDLASQEFNNAYNRFQSDRQTKANLLLGTAGLGQVSLGQQVNAGTNAANNIAQNTEQGITGAANARASGYINQGNTINSTLGSLIGLTNAFKNAQTGAPGSSPIGASGGWSTGVGIGSGTPPFLPSSNVRRGTGIFN